MPLGDHLRADEDVDLARGKAREQRGDRAAAANRVAIHARDARCGKRVGTISASTRSVPKPMCSMNSPRTAHGFGNGIE